MRKPIAALIACATLVTACAQSQPILDRAQADCAAGNRYACDQVPALQSRVLAERNTNVVVGATAVLAVAAVGVGIAALASGPRYYRPPAFYRPW